MTSHICASKAQQRFFFKRPAPYAFVMMGGVKLIREALLLVWFLSYLDSRTYQTQAVILGKKLDFHAFTSLHGGLRVGHRHTEHTDRRVTFKVHGTSTGLLLLSVIIVTIIIIMYCVLWMRQLQSDSLSSPFIRKVLYFPRIIARLTPLCYAVHILCRTLLSYYTCCSLSFTYIISRLSS